MNQSYNIHIRRIDGILTGSTVHSRSGPESNGNQNVLHIPQISRTMVSPPDSLVSCQLHPFRGKTYTSAGDIAGLF